MRPRLPIRRIPFLRPFRPPNTATPRPFTQNTLAIRSRPQLPFLFPQNRRPIALRFLSTETKQWIKGEFVLAGKITFYFWLVVGLSGVAAFGILQEYLERKFPTPEEWSFWTKYEYKNARWEESPYVDDEGYGENAYGESIVDWAMTGSKFKYCLGRLEDPNIDGAGIKEQGDDEAGILVEGVGKTGYDVSAKSEPWRRGYHDVLMGIARAAEHLDGYVRDVTRPIAFPANVVIGPSNPNPRPVNPTSASPPLEENCEPASPPPDVFYLRILTTKGFTDKQKIDAALAYGAWLEYKKTPGAAEEMYKWALDIASAGSPEKTSLNQDGSINTTSGHPSQNLLSTSTALAVHYASTSDLDEALPILISILRARRELPPAPKTMLATLDDEEPPGMWKMFNSALATALVPPPYPPPPADGTQYPLRDEKERCEEAAVMVYIGEILFASSGGSSKTNREDGLAWTREAVDIAEEELRRTAVSKGASKKNPEPFKDAKRTCSKCLEVGLGNWNTMVAKMAREEKEMKEKRKNKGGWLGFGGAEEDGMGRWESEEVVVRERVRRAEEMIKGSRGV